MRTLVVGVAPNGNRYANMAVRQLREQGHDVVALGLRAGESDGVLIQTGTPDIDGIHTITLYLNPTRQEPMIDYFLSLKPARIIFNPGTENRAFMERAQAAGIETVVGCTLIMLATGQYESKSESGTL
jgi:uncharacterized protein